MYHFSLYCLTNATYDCSSFNANPSTFPVRPPRLPIIELNNMDLI